MQDKDFYFEMWDPSEEDSSPESMMHPHSLIFNEAGSLPGMTKRLGRDPADLRQVQETTTDWLAC